MRGPVLIGLAALVFVMTIGAGSAIAKKEGRPVDKVVMFASDGMRPDLMEKYAKAGAMPTYKELMKHGVTGDNGMVQAFPPNTGVGWYTMATGTYPSVRARLDEQHVLPFRRRVHEPDVVLRRGRAPGGHDRQCS